MKERIDVYNMLHISYYKLSMKLWWRRQTFRLRRLSPIWFILIFIFISQKLWMININTFLARMFISSQFSLMYLYTMEVYPTVIRAIAVGSASSMARIGAMITPYLAQVLIKKTFVGTIAVYGAATTIAAICAFLLPIETRGRELKVIIKKKEK